MQLKNKFDLKLNLILKLIFTMVFENVSPNNNYPMIIDYMALCTNNRESTSNNYNACVFCQKFGFQEPIEIFIDENTATCPHCGIDTVIPVSEIPGWDDTYISEIESSEEQKKQILEWWSFIAFDRDPVHYNIVKDWSIDYNNHLDTRWRQSLIENDFLNNF